MKYRVIKNFGCARVGDELCNSANDPEVFTMEVSEGDINSDKYSYRSMSLDDITADVYCEDGYLELIEDETADRRIENTVELIDTLLKKYAEDHKEATMLADKGEIPPCVGVEASTVYFNLTKVLNKIREELTNE